MNLYFLDGEGALTKEIQDSPELNEEGLPEFDDYLEYDSPEYRNFDDVDEFHNNYPEYPMESDDVIDPRLNDDEKQEIVKNHIEITAAQVLAATVVALVVVSAIFIPALMNKDVEVFIDASMSGDMLYYMVSISEPAEGESYFVVVLEDGSIVYQAAILDHSIEGEVHGLNEHSKHVVEVRSGNPPLLVLERYELTDSSIWAELEYLTPHTDSIDYGVIMHGSGASATLSLVDTDTYENVYSEMIYEGESTGTITGLTAGHTYYFDVATEDTTYLLEEVTTLDTTGTMAPSIDNEQFQLNVSRETMI